MWDVGRDVPSDKPPHTTFSELLKPTDGKKKNTSFFHLKFNLCLERASQQVFWFLVVRSYDNIRPLFWYLAGEGAIWADALRRHMLLSCALAEQKRWSCGCSWTRPISVDTNQIIFQRCLGVSTPMHINLLCPNLLRKIWQMLQINCNRFSTCSNKSMIMWKTLEKMTKRRKIGHNVQRWLVGNGSKTAFVYSVVLHSEPETLKVCGR